MTKKELLNHLEQMRNSTQEAIKWLDMPPSYGKIWRLWRRSFRWSRNTGAQVAKHDS